MHNFTPEDLLLYLYKETSPTQQAEIERALHSDWALREKLAVLKESMNGLEKTSVSPRAEALRRVMDHARHSAAEALYD